MIALLQKRDESMYYILKRERSSRGVYRWRYIIDEEKAYFFGEPFMFEGDAEEVLAQEAQVEGQRYMVLEKYTEVSLETLLKETKAETVPPSEEQQPE